MIVITSKDETPRCVFKGDTFNLSINDRMGFHHIISEEIKVDKIINFIASFRFALEDGTSPGFHLMGVFACKDELPEEFKKAVMLEDLTKEQYANFVRTVGIKL